MQRIHASGLRPILEHKARVECVPTLGICLGMQLLTRGSEEGAEPGLVVDQVCGIIPDTHAGQHHCQ